MDGARAQARSDSRPASRPMTPRLNTDVNPIRIPEINATKSHQNAWNEAFINIQEHIKYNARTLQLQQKQIAYLLEALSRVRSNHTDLCDTVATLKDDVCPPSPAEKEKFDGGEVELLKTRISQIGAKADSIDHLKTQVERMTRRLGWLEDSSASRSPALSPAELSSPLAAEPAGRISRQEAVFEKTPSRLDSPGTLLPPLVAQGTSLRPFKGQASQLASGEIQALPGLRALDAASGIVSWNLRPSLPGRRAQSLSRPADLRERTRIYGIGGKIDAIEASSYQESEAGRAAKRQKPASPTSTDGRSIRDRSPTAVEGIRPTSSLADIPAAHFSHCLNASATDPSRYAPNPRTGAIELPGRHPESLARPLEYHARESGTRRFDPAGGTVTDVYRDSVAVKPAWERATSQHDRRTSMLNHHCDHHDPTATRRSTRSPTWLFPHHHGENLNIFNINGKRSRAKPVRNDEGILIRKDGRPDMRSISSARNLRKVHAAKRRARREEKDAERRYTSATSLDEDNGHEPDALAYDASPDEAQMERHYEGVDPDSAETAPEDRSPVTPDREEPFVDVRIKSSAGSDKHEMVGLKRSSSEATEGDNEDGKARQRSRSRPRLDSSAGSEVEA